MGMYDTVTVPCPACGERAEFQSKSGDCTLATFTLEEAPDDVLIDVTVNRHGPIRCKCGALFGVEVSGQRPRRTLTARSVVVDVDAYKRQKSEAWEALMNRACQRCGSPVRAYGFEDHLCYNCRNPPSD